MLDPVVMTIQVPCSQEAAFRVFVDEVTTWWPLKYSVSGLGGGMAQSVRIEPKTGGLVVEVGQDGTEHHWGTVRTYDPFVLFRMDFHMGLPAPEAPSLVEVRFTPLGEERTQVVLTQSNWEAFGDKAADMQGGYGGAWVHIFETAFRKACEG